METTSVATELRLGLPGTDHHHQMEEQQTLYSVRNNKRPSPDTVDDCGVQGKSEEVAPVAK
ncbi:hypothetical protein Dsin_029755 [Dipteronia sinensis]|uniref:Uncharacterized protein n=1 Tax=Dipteronia sinensis TaxID=43782 RepID=A0AAE0DVV0_9ROSI|nr:hypothetical protein Dsin_029755 [Dipteronia sinensis]